MSREKLNKLLSMITNPVKRRHLIEFKTLAFCVSKQVGRLADENEEVFYFVLSNLKFDKNGNASAVFEDHQLFITVIEISDEQQAESTFILHAVTINEEYERPLEQLEIEAWVESGAIEIE